METLPFFIYLFAHLAGLVIGFGSVLVTDSFGFLWIIKKARFDFILKITNITKKLIWTGWYVMVVSGVNLIILKGYLDNLTKVKLFFVALVGLNGIYLHYISKGLEKFAPQNEIPSLYKFRLTLGTFVSQLGWWGAILIGFVHRHIQHTINWPDNYLGLIAGIAIFIGGTALWGEWMFNKKFLKTAK